jgi:DNA-binding LytR/AlgR family response regulator
MSQISAIIADDEANLRQYLQTKLSVLWPELNIVGHASNGLEAVELIHTHQPTLAFLDIQMPGLTGLDVAQKLQQQAHHQPHIIFVTAYDQYAVAAFEQHAADYLLKPITDERLSRCIAHVKQLVQKQSSAPDLSLLMQQIAQLSAAANANTKQGKVNYLRWIRASERDVVRQIPVEDVLFLQAQDKYVVVMTRSGESLIRISLSELIDTLDPDQFWQIHRSTVVNMQHVVSSSRSLMGTMLLQLRDSHHELQVSRGYQHLFKQM